MVECKKILWHVACWVFPIASRIDTLVHTPPQTLLAHAQPAPAIHDDDMIAVFSYADADIKALIWALKYHHRTDAAAPLGRALALHVTEALAERRMYGTFLSPLIVPIPLHAKREAERGYNQTSLIARAFAQAMEFPRNAIRADILLRTKYTPALARSVSRQARYESIEGAFAVADPALVKNKEVILIDDVITSGATMTQARNMLKSAGARDVLMLAIAH